MPRPLLRWLTSLLVAFVGIAALAQEHTAPMELRHNLPFVQVMVNGKGPFTFSIDTGTGGQALVSPDLIEQLKLPVTGEAQIGDPSGINQHKASIVKLESLEVAGVTFKNVEAVQFRASPREGPVDGILGFPLFRDYLLTLDYPGQRLVLAMGSLKPDGENSVIPFTMPNDVPTVVMKVGNQTIDTHVDSRGAGLMIPDKLAHQLKYVSDPIVIGRGRTASNEFEIKGAQLDAEIRLGSYTFPQPFVEITPLLPDANFGARALKNFTVTFDQKGLLMKLESKDKTITMPPPQARPVAGSSAQHG